MVRFGRICEPISKNLSARNWPTLRDGLLAQPQPSILIPTLVWNTSRTRASSHYIGSEHALLGLELANNQYYTYKTYTFTEKC